MRVDLFVDPICPFAWLTSRWLAEVERLRPLAVAYRVMSLSVLNEDRDDIPDFYRELVDRGWGPVRTAIAVELHHGSAALRRFYEEFALRLHSQARQNDQQLVEEALDAAGLPIELAAAAGTADYDEALRASHAAGIERVGSEVGTPTLHVHLGGAGELVAFFGPVLNPIPRGAAAARLWDGIVMVAGEPSFFELKRSRTSSLSFA